MHKYILFLLYVFSDDFIALLQRCKSGLTEGGCIVIKDNVAGREPVLDEDDSSVTRYFSNNIENETLSRRNTTS